MIQLSREFKHHTMKKICLLFVSILFTGSLIAQKTQTLFSDENSYGGFGGPIVEFSNINGITVGDVGGGGAFSVNNFFVGGYGLGNNGSQVTIDDKNYDIHFNHGGFWLGYTFKQHHLFHLYTSARIGWGKTELKRNDEKFYSDNLLALSPELGVELNVTNWFKVAFSGGYRNISGIDNLPELTDNDFTGAYGAITFRFGAFGNYRSYDKHHSEEDQEDY